MQKTHSPLTDFQWQYIEKIVDNGRKRKTCLRMVVTAILRVTRTGMQWRELKGEQGKKLPIILYYFYRWQRDGTWERVLSFLVREVRKAHDFEPEPSCVAVDSQSVKVVPFTSETKGKDGFKRVNGRKRHLLVDKLGFPVAVGVSAANEHDGIQGIELLWKQSHNLRLELIRADSAYQGQFVEAAQLYGWQVEFGQKPESQKGFVPQKGRWQVERSFSWLNFYRRLSRDFEKKAASAISFIQIAFINIALLRLERLKT